jgi:hypothetical protein
MHRRRQLVVGDVVAVRVLADVAQDCGHIVHGDLALAPAQKLERPALALQRRDLTLALLVREPGAEIRPAAVLRLERGKIPVVGDLIAVGDRHDVIDPARGPVLAGAVDDPGLAPVCDQEARVEVEVAHHLAVAALAECLDGAAHDLHSLARGLATLDRDAQQVEAAGAVGLRLQIAERRLVADRDTVLVAAELGAPGPEGAPEDHRVRSRRLRDGAMSDAHNRPIPVLARRIADHVLRLVDLGICALRQEHGAAPGAVPESHERVTHDYCLSPVFSRYRSS